MNKIQKQAQADAERWAAAEMFYGEGAGTRRKLVGAEIDFKMTEDEYASAFEKAYNALDMNKIAQAAIKERKSIDRAARAGQNLRALKRGDISSLTTGVYVVAGIVIVAHATGYDKKIEAKAMELYKKARVEVKYRKARYQGRNVERIL